MKRLIIFLLVAMAAGFSGSCKDRETDGGWTSVDPGNSDVVRAVEFIKKELAAKHPDVRAGKVREAVVQTVAGENYRIRIEYTSDTNKKPEIMEVKLFLSLEDRFSIDSIKF